MEGGGGGGCLEVLGSHPSLMVRTFTCDHRARPGGTPTAIRPVSLAGKQSWGSFSLLCTHEEWGRLVGSAIPPTPHHRVRQESLCVSTTNWASLTAVLL